MRRAHIEPAQRDELDPYMSEVATLPEGDESLDLSKILAGFVRRWPLAL